MQDILWNLNKSSVEIFTELSYSLYDLLKREIHPDQKVLFFKDFKAL